MSLLEDYVANLLPLLPRGIDAGRIVGTCMEKDYGACGKGVQGVEEGLVSETDRPGVVIRVRDRLDADITEDGEVVDCLMKR